MKLSATVITLNEEKDLPRCLSSLKNLVDETIVVDCGSRDKTVEIAKKFGAKVYKRTFDTYSNQKNFASSKARGNWILSVDADEVISSKLASEIKSRVSGHGPPITAYSMPRKNIIFGKFIKYTRWQPELDRHIWLYKKDKGKWLGDVHEEVVAKGEVGKLENAKIHYQYETVKEFLEMMNRYSELDAQEMVKNGVKFSFLRFLFEPIYNFLVRYFYRFGFLDGWRGFTLSYLMAIYHLELWVKIWERRRVK